MKLYGKFQLRRKTREAAYWGSALSIVASGGLALQAAFNIVVQKLITKQSAKEISEGIDDIPAGSTRLADDAPETAVIREAIQALDRRVSGEIKPFGLTVVDYGDRSGFDAFAGVGRDGKPHYLISADYARAPDQKMAEVYAAVLAHEHAHAYKNDIAHLRGAGPGGWRALRAPAYAAAGLIAVKAVILASPLMALPYAGIASTFLLGPGLLWTAGLLAAFLGLSAAYAMLDAAVYRVIEYEADYFAAGHTNPDWVIRMLEHFEKNMTPEEIESGPFALHPSLAERIARLRAVFEKGRKP